MTTRTTRAFAAPLLAALLAAFAAGCSSVKLDDKTAPVESRTDGTAGSAGTGAAGAGKQAYSELDDPNSPLAKRSVFFDFDSFTIRDEFRPTLEAHARYLSADRNRKVVVEGNTDEQGSREYNLALGQKRAEAVRRSLTTLGVADAQVEAVSFGEEKLRATGGDEASRAQNRRADLSYR